MQGEHKKRDGERCGARALTGQNRYAMHAHPGRSRGTWQQGRSRTSGVQTGRFKGVCGAKDRSRSPRSACRIKLSKFAQGHDNYDTEASPDPKWVEVSEAGEVAFRKGDAEAKAS